MAASTENHCENQFNIENYDENDETITITISLPSEPNETEVCEDISVVAAESLSSSSQMHNCNICDDLFETGVELTNHIDEWHQDDVENKNPTENETQIELPIDNNINESNLEFSRHLKVEQIKIEEEYFPRTLNYQFIKEESSPNTKNDTENNENEGMGAGREETLFICKFSGCNDSFTHEKLFWAHLNTHRRVKPHRCHFENCTAAFKLESSLARHMVIHSGARLFICNIQRCQKVFTTRFLLERHIRSHGIHKPFKCSHNDCQASFTLGKYLTRHLRTHHKRIFACDFEDCKKVFGAKDKLDVHQLVHSDEDKPFKCEYKFCRASFKYLQSWEHHSKVHDGEAHENA